MTDIASIVMDAITVNHRERNSRRLGASQIGHECRRRLWLGFRWARLEKFTGRILRIFKTGHQAEARLVSELRVAGMRVLDVDENTDEQFVFSACDGHFVAKIDGVVLGVPGAENTWHLLEMKTVKASGFRAIVKDGCKQHMAQVQVSMLMANLEWCLYVVENKDTSELYVERVTLNDKLASDLLGKAQRIITAPAPDAVGYKPTFFKCKFCHFHSMCHSAVAPAKNCRTCCFSTPEMDGVWRCSKLDTALTIEAQAEACDEHLFVPPMFGTADSYEFIDGSVRYKMRSGYVWANASVTGFPSLDAGNSFDIMTSDMVAGQSVSGTVPF